MIKKIVGFILGGILGWILAIAFTLFSATTLRDRQPNALVNILSNANLIFWVLVIGFALLGLFIVSNGSRKSKIIASVSAAIIILGLFFGISLG